LTRGRGLAWAFVKIVILLCCLGGPSAKYLESQLCVLTSEKYINVVLLCRLVRRSRCRGGLWSKKAKNYLQWMIPCSSAPVFLSSSFPPRLPTARWLLLFKAIICEIFMRHSGAILAREPCRVLALCHSTHSRRATIFVGPPCCTPELFPIMSPYCSWWERGHLKARRKRNLTPTNLPD